MSKKHMVMRLAYDAKLDQVCFLCFVRKQSHAVSDPVLHEKVVITHPWIHVEVLRLAEAGFGNSHGVSLQEEKLCSDTM